MGIFNFHFTPPRPRFKVGEAYEALVRGACCAECLKPLTEGGVFHNADTTHRTVHWECRTLQDDPKKDSAP